MTAFEKLKCLVWDDRRNGFDAWLLAEGVRDAATERLLWRAWGHLADKIAFSLLRLQADAATVQREKEREIAALTIRLEAAEDKIIWAASRLEAVLSNRSVLDANEVIELGRSTAARRDDRNRHAVTAS